MSATTYAMVSSADWGLDAGALVRDDNVRARLGASYATLEDRCRNAVEQFVLGTYDDAIGAARHYYSAAQRCYDVADSGNFLIAINFLTMYDRYGDPAMLDRAESCYRWAYANCVETHPMFSWQGGVRDGFKPHELYVKYTGDALLTALAIYARRPNEDLLHHVIQYRSFIKRAREAGFRFTYDRDSYTWINGFEWRGFGGPVLALLQCHETLHDPAALREAVRWGEFGLSQISPDGGFFLLDGQFWNSDLTALEIRSLVHLYELTAERRFLDGAARMAAWLVKHQRADGAWPIGIDADGEVCAPNVGPGDMPHIALALLRLHMVEKENALLDAAVAACRYAIGQQLCEPGQPYWEDERARWGFWSWDPRHDFTLSGDQVVHHVRGIVAVADYLGRDRGQH